WPIDSSSSSRRTSTAGKLRSLSISVTSLPLSEPAPTIAARNNWPRAEEEGETAAILEGLLMKFVKPPGMEVEAADCGGERSTANAKRPRRTCRAKPPRTVLSARRTRPEQPRRQEG